MNKTNKFKSPFLEKKERLLENEVGFVIYDGFPVSKGHCLIVPHRVYCDYFDYYAYHYKDSQCQRTIYR